MFRLLASTVYIYIVYFCKVTFVIGKCSAICFVRVSPSCLYMYMFENAKNNHQSLSLAQPDSLAWLISKIKSESQNQNYFIDPEGSWVCSRAAVNLLEMKCTQYK